MSNNILIRNIDPQQITINGAGQPTGITNVYVNGVDVTVGTKAYVLVPTNNNELINGAGYITAAEETDPTVPSYVKAISLADINSWNDKQDQLVSGSTIKTINNTSLLGSGDIQITATDYVAGTGIDITDNTISNTITSYQDLTDTPTIPTRTSDLVNDSGFITNQTDSLVNYLTTEVLEDILPHTSDSGTGDLYLEDSVKYKIKMELNPSEIQQKTTSGKQLFDLTAGTYSNNGVDAVVTDGVITLSGTASANAFIDIPVATDLTWTDTETYTVSAFNSSTANVNIRINTSGTFDTQLNATNKTNTFTYGNEVNMTTNKIILRVQSGTALSNFSFTPMLEIGSGSATYEEYTGGMPSPNPLYPQDIHVTSGENTIIISNKNLINPSSAYTGTSNGVTTTYDSDTQSLSYSGTLTGTWCYLTNKINLKYPSGDYTFSINKSVAEHTTIIRLYYNENSYQDVTINKNTTSRNATVLNGIVAYQIYLAGLTISDELDNTLNFQLEIGNTTTSIIKHEETEYPIDLGTAEYLKLGDSSDILFKNVPSSPYYRDNWPYGRWYIANYVDIVYLIDNAEFTDVEETADSYIFSNHTPVNINPPSYLNNSYGKSIYFKDTNLDNNNYINIVSGKLLEIKLDKKVGISTTEELNQWLIDNDVIAYFPTITYISISNVNDNLNEQLEALNNAESYDGGTNISQENDDLPFDIEADTLRKVS